MSAVPYTFGSMVATESIEARRVVYKFAETLHREQSVAVKQDESGQVIRPRAATWEECLAKSRQIRVKRERDDSHSNRLISRHNNL